MPIPVQIEQYSIAWHPTNGAAYRIKLKGNANWSNWVQIPSTELSALAAVLGEDPVYVDNNGWISTGPEPVGD